MKTITTIGYAGNIRPDKNNKTYAIYHNKTIFPVSDKFRDDFNQLLDQLKWSNFDGFRIHHRIKTIEIFSNSNYPYYQIIDNQIIQDNPNFDYLGSGDQDLSI